MGTNCCSYLWLLGSLSDLVLKRTCVKVMSKLQRHIKPPDQTHDAVVAGLRCKWSYSLAELSFFCLQLSSESESAWEKLRCLGPEEELPKDMPEMFYFNLESHLRCGDYIERLQPYFELFPREK